MLSLFQDWHQNYQLRKITTAASDVAWKRVKTIWAIARTVYRGPIGFQATLMFEYKALLAFVATHPDCEKYLVEALHDPNPMVCAYCLIALERTGSRHLEVLPEGLLYRPEVISWRLADYAFRNTLGEFAQSHLPTISSPFKT